MWVDYRGSLSTVHKDGEISTCGQIKEVHSVQPTCDQIEECRIIKVNIKLKYVLTWLLAGSTCSTFVLTAFKNAGRTSK